MSKRHPVDELFRRRLVRHETPVSDDLFSRIQQSRATVKEQPARRPVWLLFSFLALGLLAVGFFFGYLQGQQDVPEQGFFPISVDKSTNAVAKLESPVTLPIEAAEASTAILAEVGTPNQVIVAEQSQELIAAVAVEDEPIGEFVSNPQKDIEVEQPEDAIHPAEVNAILADLKAEMSERKMEELPKLAICDLDPLPTTDLVMEASRSPNNPRCAKFGNRKWHFDLDVLAGPTYGLHQFDDRTAENGDHLSKRQSTETSVLSYGSMVRLSALAPNGMALRAGLAYSQLNTRFDYLNEDDLIVQIEIRYDPEGNVIAIDSNYVGGTRKLVQYNRFQMLEVPLAVGYEFSCGRLKMAVNAGASLNLAFAAEGVFLDPNTDQPVEFSSASRANVFRAYQSHIGASLDASVSLRYHIGGRFSLLAEPYYRHYTSSLTNTNYSLAHNATLIGLNMGLRMRL